MSKRVFFEEMTPQSGVKVELVTKYFAAWSRILAKNSELAYVDLFSGPGVYQNGIPSTPLRIIGHALNDPRLTNGLRTFFNDANPDHADQLQQNLAALADVESLRHTPIVRSTVVSTQLISQVAEFYDTPALTFVDPWGYKGVTADLVRAAIRGKGSECILFFNFNRVNAALTNRNVSTHMHAFFGDEILDSLLNEIRGTSPNDREALVLKSVKDMLKHAGAKFTLEFKFEQIQQERTSHYVLFATKHKLGAQIMNDIMARASTRDDGIHDFKWAPARSPQLPLPLGLERSQHDLEIDQFLVDRYQGGQYTVREIFDALSSDSRYTLDEVKQSLKRLEQTGRIKVDAPPSSRKRGDNVTMGNNRVVRFHPKE